VSETKPAKCRCLHFCPCEDEFPDACCCGHTVEEHAPTKRYPGDTSCKGDDEEDED
jgi:hypothetical protein